jgi:hypothetical protein
MRVTTTSLFILFAVAGTAVAQDEVARRQAVEIAARVPLEKAVTRAPYSAETVVEGVQALADGNRIVRKTTGRVYRDGEGRTRREEEGQVMTARIADVPVTANRRTTISIVDPVAGFSYALDPERKIAWRTAIGAGSEIMNKLDAAKMEQVKAELERRAARTAGAADKPSTDAKVIEEQKMVEEQKREMAAAGGRGGRGGMAGGEGRMRGSAIMAPQGPIERKTLGGVLVEGRKTTTVIPAGQVGNEQPLTIVSEEWRSPDLQVLVMTRYSDPRTGDSTYRLLNIIRAEPDRSLFMIPPDYEVRETGIKKMLELSERK